MFYWGTGISTGFWYLAFTITLTFGYLTWHHQSNIVFFVGKPGEKQHTKILNLSKTVKLPVILPEPIV